MVGAPPKPIGRTDPPVRRTVPAEHAPPFVAGGSSTRPWKTQDHHLNFQVAIFVPISFQNRVAYVTGCHASCYAGRSEVALLRAIWRALQKMNAREADFAACRCMAYTYCSVAGIGHVFNLRNVLVKNCVAGFSLAAGSGQKASTRRIEPHAACYRVACLFQRR